MTPQNMLLWCILSYRHLKNQQMQGETFSELFFFGKRESPPAKTFSCCRSFPQELHQPGKTDFCLRRDTTQGEDTPLGTFAETKLGFQYSKAHLPRDYHVPLVPKCILTPKEASLAGSWPQCGQDLHCASSPRVENKRGDSDHQCPGILQPAHSL